MATRIIPELSGKSAVLPQDALSKIEEIKKYIRKLLDQETTLANIRLMHDNVSLLEYYLKYGGREGWKPAEQHSFGNLRCGIEGCEMTMPLFNIAAALGNYEWRCLSHIPPEITFPIGLHGEEWTETGRK